MSYKCQAVRRDGTLCPNWSVNIRSSVAGPVAVCGHHVRSHVHAYGRQFEPADIWPEGLLVAAEIYDQLTQRHLGTAELYTAQATRSAAQAAECRVRAEWKRESEKLGLRGG